MIRIPQVRVVDEEGAQLGVMPTPQALSMAQDRGYDLVEVAPMASPPVVRFLDFGQYKYELTKREKEAKRRQRSVTFKEVRLKPKIGQGDFDTKVRRAIEFLEDGDRIKVAVQFRGRELTHPEIGRNLLTRFTEQIKDHGTVERQPLLEGKSMHVTVASTHKPKIQEPAISAARAKGAPANGDARAAGAPDGQQPAAEKPVAERPVAERPVAEKSVAEKQAPEPAPRSTAEPAAPEAAAESDSAAAQQPEPQPPAPQQPAATPQPAARATSAGRSGSQSRPQAAARGASQPRAASTGE
jgi:translation initiation factor IF-3